MTEEEIESREIKMRTVKYIASSFEQRVSTTMMKFSLILVSSLTAAIRSAEAKPFGIKPPARPVSPSKQISTALALRGGDLGPLTADTAAKALVGFQVVNGYLTWQAAEGIVKAWGGDKSITYKQKSLIEWTGFNMFTTAMVGVFLLNGASSSTALGLLNLMYVMNCVALLFDDFHGKFGLEPGGLLINNALYSVIAFGNLLNQEWATLASNIGAICLCIEFILTGKFKEVWKRDTGEGSVSTLAWNNWIFTTFGNIVCWIALMKVSEVNKIIAYSHVPSALICVYNAFFSKAAKEAAPESAYRVIVVALMAVILL